MGLASVALVLVLALSCTPLRSEAAEFACADGRETISATLVNDDYCDCSDGSDEPGTSACSHVGGVVFFCRDEGHVSSAIPTSRVGDGLCDCCDGSDEASGVCANTCQDLGRELFEATAASQRALRAGLVRRREMVAQTRRAMADSSLAEADAAHHAEALNGLVARLTSRLALEQELETQERVIRARSLMVQIPLGPRRFVSASTSSAVGAKGVGDANPETAAADGAAGVEEKDEGGLLPAGDEVDAVGSEGEGAAARILLRRARVHVMFETAATKEAPAALVLQMQTRTLVKFLDSEPVPVSRSDGTTLDPQDLVAFTRIRRRWHGSGSLVSIVPNWFRFILWHVSPRKVRKWLSLIPPPPPPSGVKKPREDPISQADRTISQQVRDAISQIDGGESSRRVTFQEVKAQQEGRRSRKWRRKNGFMGPIFNGGRKGWTRAYNIIMDVVGLALSPVRIGWDVTAWCVYHLSRFVRWVTPAFIAAPVAAARGGVGGVLWTNAGQSLYNWWRIGSARRVFLRSWHTSDAYYNYYFPTLDTTWERPGARTLREAIGEAKSEQASWIERAATAKGALASSHDLGPDKIFLDMVGRCIETDKQGYHYSLCPFDKVTQTGTVLGRWEGWNGVEVEGRPMSKYLSMGFTEGTPCFGGQR